MAGICTSLYSFPYPIEKVGDFPYPYHTQSMREFPVKTGMDSGNIHEDEFICHL